MRLTSNGEVNDEWTYRSGATSWIERLPHERAYHHGIDLPARALTSRDAQINSQSLVRQRTLSRCVMQRKVDRLVSCREDNVLWVDFRRDPDPPAPRFPGAGGLREIVDKNTSATKHIADALPKLLAAKHGLGAGGGAGNASPEGQRCASRIARGSIAA